VKEKTIEVPKIENHQDGNIIAYIDKIYKEIFNKFIYFRWIAELMIIVVKKNVKPIG
jgi:hypothetical protein